MSKYHKIQTVWLRDPETNHKTLLEGRWAKPEFGYLNGVEWVYTEKIDGTNVRLVREGREVKGRTDNAQLHTGLFGACRAITESDAFASLPEGMILYGEGYGGKIQKGGGRYREDQGFVLFDAWCGMWLEQDDVVELAQTLAVDVVPVIGMGTLGEMVARVRDQRGMESMMDEERDGFLAEGIVARPRVEMMNRRGERIITKLKCKDFPEAAR